MASLALYLAIALGVHAFALWMLRTNHRSLFQLTPATYPTPSDSAPRASIVVPARNEEANVERCVRSLLAQDYPAFEVVVVDDRSTDRTGEILARLAAADLRLVVVSGKEPPADWLGKNHAIWQGVVRATGDYLLFVDADTELHPAALAQAIAHARREGSGLLTLLPALENRTFWERTIQPAIAQLVLAWFPARLINDPRWKKVASANGPFLLFSRAAYEAIGGHEAVKDDIVEDLTLARRIKAGGHRLTYVQGAQLQRLRMYTSLREIWTGWVKNFHAAVGGSLVGAILGAVAICAVFILPWALLPILLTAALQGVHGAWLAFLMALAVVFTSVRTSRTADRLFHLDAGSPWLAWLGFAVAAAILVHSTFRHRAGRGFTWKGRAQGARA